MATQNHQLFPTAHGYMTDSIRRQYIEMAERQELLPENAARMSQIISLEALQDSRKPIQFWQLYSVLGQDRIVSIVEQFYNRVFSDEPWFKSVFANISGKTQHINTQASMWIDVMGGGLAYHGGEFRLSFHHTHNAMQLMNEKGSTRWAELMVSTLNDPALDLTDDPRVRTSLNTFLSYFFGRYSDEFGFANGAVFGDTNPAIKRAINFMNMTSDAIEALSEDELKEVLASRGLDITQYQDKAALVAKALRL